MYDADIKIPSLLAVLVSIGVISSPSKLVDCD